MQKAEQQETRAFEMREREVETSDGKARIKYVVCQPLERAGFVNAFSTRLGGLSPLPEAALNLATFKGDQKENVVENRRRFLMAIGAKDAQIMTGRQTHSTERCVIESEAEALGLNPDCDAMTTRVGG